MIMAPSLTCCNAPLLTSQHYASALLHGGRRPGAGRKADGLDSHAPMVECLTSSALTLTRYRVLP